MTKLDIAKRVTSFIVGVGVTKIVQGVVSNNTDPEKVTDQVAIVAGAMVLGSMTSDMTRKYTDARIDELSAWYNDKFKKNA